MSAFFIGPENSTRHKFEPVGVRYWLCIQIHTNQQTDGSKANTVATGCLGCLFLRAAFVSPIEQFKLLKASFVHQDMLGSN
jgi:hypothetical protein